MANVVELGARTSIQRQARKWLIRMDSDKSLSDAEKKALSNWMSCSASHQRELVRLARFWNHANILTELMGGVAARGREQKERRGRSRIPVALVAVGAVLASVVLVYAICSHSV